MKNLSSFPPPPSCHLAPSQATVWACSNRPILSSPSTAFAPTQSYQHPPQKKKKKQHQNPPHYNLFSTFCQHQNCQGFSYGILLKVLGGLLQSPPFLGAYRLCVSPQLTPKQLLDKSTSNSLLSLPLYHLSFTDAPGAFHFLALSIPSLPPRRAPRPSPASSRQDLPKLPCLLLSLSFPVNLLTSTQTAVILTALQTHGLCSGSLISFILF